MKKKVINEEKEIVSKKINGSLKEKFKKLKNEINIKKIASLTKILCKDYFESLPAFSNKNSTQGKLFKVCSLIALVTLAYLSYEIMKFLNMTTTPQIFLNVYLLIMAMIVIFQQIIASTNVYYFSKDLEYILPFPIKPIELLIARFNMLISVSYVSMLLFAFVPLLIYGLMAANSPLYYLGMILILLIFPIFFGLIVSSVMIFVMQLTKIIKNKEVFQFIVTLIMMLIITSFETVAISQIFSNTEQIEQIQIGESINLLEIMNEKVENFNKYLLTINPSVEILIGKNILKNIIELFKIILINVLIFIIFIFIGKILYLKNLLSNIQKVNISKIKKKYTNYKYKKTSPNIAYIKNEFRELIKTPSFFMQCVFPIITMVILLTVLIISVYPSIISLMQNEEVKEQVGEVTFDISLAIAIIIIAQIIFTFSSLSITAISRKGENAFFIKYIPISLYKQFLFLNIPQVILNTIISIVILGAAKYLIPEITILQLILMFITIIVLNIINSFLMLIVDCIKPNLEWDNETDAIKQNQNKLYQYVLTILLILILVYFAQIFEKINLTLAMIIVPIIFIIIFLIINKIIKKKIDKLFTRII